MEYGNEEHLDLRQRKTRKLLVEALAQLLEEKSFQELSVTDICRRAMVHRTTFYAHFNDKQELMRYLLRAWSGSAPPPACPRTRSADPGSICSPPPSTYFSSLPSAGHCIAPVSTAAQTPWPTPWRTALPESCAACCRSPASGPSPLRWIPRWPPTSTLALCFPSSAGGSPAMSLSPPATCCPTWNNSFPFSEALLCRKNVRKDP